MFNLIQKLIEKTLNKRFKKNFKSTSKKSFTQAASLELTGETDKNKAKLVNGIKIILKKYGNNPEKLLEFVKKNGTEIYRVNPAKKLLKLIGYEEGFLVPGQGIKSLYINTVISAFAGEKIKFSLETEPKFILSKKPVEQYFMVQQFYKWYAKKLNLPGLEPDTQENLQKFLNSNNEDIKSLSIEEILELKEAIARDVESIDFIVDLIKNTDGSKNALKKMTDGGASV